ncbi:hypothetical protein [Propionivibrio sp.]|jgi:hypothetical protein|uniref:hypothetical protein n=1 Tax=Propionivibrio sp. TaxID=2212460 RepID=UPI0025F23530|nr:hypothetical protein [Propionivibrio sp.]MBK8746130.1 hypothetical protein [Propionivibrio sp.]
MSSNQKILVALLLFLAWGALVINGQTPVQQFVDALRDALIAIGVFQATLTNPKGPS